MAAANNGFQTLSADIEAYHQRHKMTESNFQEKKLLKNRLEAIIQKHSANHAKLVFYGSTVNGFATDSSDVDISLQMPLENQRRRPQWSSGRLYPDELERGEAVSTLSGVHRNINTYCDNVSDVEFITDTNVPLIRGVDDDTGCQWQITSSNTSSIRVSGILRAYSKMDARVVPLVTIVKKWAASHDINNAREATPNNYCWTLLVIYYLKAVCSPPVLPSSIPENVNLAALQQGNLLESVRNTPNFRSENTESLGSLLAAFFAYYTDNIDCSRVFSVRANRQLQKHEVQSRTPRRQWDCLLCVEDPCTLKNVPRSVFKYTPFASVRTNLQRTSRLLNTDVSLSKIF